MSKTNPVPTEAPCLTDEQIRATIEVEQVVTMWGQPCTITPRFVEERLGDGLQWIWLSPMMYRPNYYVIRVDSGWDMDNMFSEVVDGETIEHDEEILQAIEARYGYYDDEEETEGEEEEDEPCCEFPYVNIEDGFGWGPYQFQTGGAS